jgi:hypothetical protein
VNKVKIVNWIGNIGWFIYNNKRVQLHYKKVIGHKRRNLKGKTIIFDPAAIQKVKFTGRRNRVVLTLTEYAKIIDE